MESIQDMTDLDAGVCGEFSGRCAQGNGMREIFGTSIPFPPLEAWLCDLSGEGIRDTEVHGGG